MAFFGVVWTALEFWSVSAVGEWTVRSLVLLLGFDAWEGIDPSVSESVGGAFEGDDVGVVDDAVDHRGGDDLVSEHAGPGTEGQVAGQDQRGVFIAGRDELEEQVRCVLFEGR